MAKKRKEFHLENETLEYLKEMQEAYNFSNASKTLEKIIEEHRDKNASINIDDFSKKLAKEVALLLNKPLTRIRLGTNNADRNSEVTLLLLNSLLSYSGYKSFVTEETPQLIAAKNKVADKINVFRKKKLEREKTKKEKPTLLQDIEIEEINWGDVDGDS